MAKPTIVIGALLIFVGVFGYLFGHTGTGPRSPTALIPSAVGVVLAVLGVVSLNDQARKHAMHAAALVGLLALIAVGIQIPKRWEHASGAALASMIVTVLLCAIFMVLCVRSFIQARRNRG